MRQDPLEDLFKKNSGSFDLHETPKGHQSRFMERLNAKQTATVQPTKRRTFYRPLMAVAAIALLALLVTGVFNANQQEEQGLASVSPEMAETQEFFTLAINQQLTKLQSFESEASKKLVNDALIQLDNLEKEYQVLVEDLMTSGNDKRVVHALIANLQSRIDLLEEMTITIEAIEQINQNQNDETSINTL